jgi:hypothetical protein
MRTVEELEAMFGGAQALRELKAAVKADVDGWPPLTARQRDALRLLLVRRMPPRPAKLPALGAELSEAA